MCTAVVGGSIHRAATRISAASDQRSTTPMTRHRIKDRTKPVRSGVLVSVFGIAVTFQNDSLGWVAALISYKSIIFLDGIYCDSEGCATFSALAARV